MSATGQGVAGTNKVSLEREYGVKFLRGGEGLDRIQKTKSVPFDADEYVEIDQVLKKTADLFGLDAVRALHLRFVKVVDPDENVATCSKGRFVRIPNNRPLKGNPLAGFTTAYEYRSTIELKDTPSSNCYMGDGMLAPCTKQYDIHDVAFIVSSVLDDRIRGVKNCKSSSEIGHDNAAFLGEKLAGKRNYENVPDHYYDRNDRNRITDVTALRQRLRGALHLPYVSDPLTPPAF